MMTYNFFRVAFVLPYFCLSVQGSHYKVGDLKISCPNDDWVSVGTNCFYHSSKAYDAHSGQVFCQKLFGQSLATQSLLHTANFYQLSELAQHIPDATFWTSFYINVAVNDKIDSHDAFEKIRVHSRSLINISTPLINPNWAKLQPNLLKGKTWHNGTLCVAFNANKTDIQNYGWSLKQCNELFGVICQTFGCLNYTNGPSEFRCTDNSACIPKAHMCDHVQDCLDNSDENCAPETENCNNFQYQAIKNGRIKIDKVVNRDISHCNWHIEFADADNVVINLLTLGMSSSYIIITEVESGIVHQLDNNKTQITVPANVFIAYNGEATHNGIEIRYHAEGNSICNKTFVSWDGSFSPPMQTAHPNLYRTSTNCEWTIANTEQKPLAIKIPRFWLAKTDYLLIYEFTNNIASLLGNFTKYQPPPVAFVTMQQNLLFRFRTVKNTVGADGFTVFFERKCLEVTVETTHGYIQSTNFNKVFPFVAFEQTYRIVVPCKPYTKCSTQLFFDHLNITNFDDITVKSGNKTQILSGSTIPMPFRAEAPIIEIGMIAMTDKFSAKITFSVDCELPTSNRIRLINPSTTSYRSIVSFGCTYDKNWHLFNATCGAGGIWSDIPNICTQQPKVEKHCPVGIIEKGRVVELNRAKHFMKYECNFGSKADENTTVVCQDGNWNSKPHCTSIQCVVPPNEADLPDYCCSTCLYKDCSPAKSKAQQEISFELFKKIEYYCDENYTLYGDSRYQICQEDGTWTKNAIYCRPTKCGLQEVIKNSNNKFFTILKGSSNSVDVCLPGFSLNSDLECEADSERIKNTTCELIPVILPECPDKTNHFDTFHYCMCDESYENDDYRCVIADFCAQFGDTMCKHGTCLIHKESCFCDSDYQTVGDDSSSYVLPPLKYNWTTLIYKHTACIKKRCSKKQIDGFVVALHSPYFYFGESIIIYDRNTHHVKGVETCDINYQWEHSLKNKCEAPTGVDRYTPVLSEYPLYTEVTVACEDLVQKHLLGPQRIVCLKGGWSYESMCRWHQCADPQLNGVNFTVRNQALGYTYNFGVILDLFCENADEKLEGNPSMECIAGHSNLQPVKWDRERKPYCKKKFECELRVGNGVLASAEGLMIGESANFACIQPNYVLSNPNPVTCVKKPRLTRSNRCIAQWNAPDYVILNASASFYCELLQECSELKIRWISHQTPGRFKNFRSGNSAFGTIQKVQDGDQGVYTCDVVDFNGELADQITVHLNINHNGTAGTNTNVFGPVSMIEVPNVSIYSPHLDQPVPECIDQQPMQLECLSELHLEQRQSGSIKPISVPWPTVKDNDPNIQISSSLIGLTAQPYTFNGKEKEIRWLSSDQHGNQAACVTKLIVEEFIPLKIKCPNHYVEQLHNTIGPEINIKLPEVEVQSNSASILVHYHPQNLSSWHVDRPLIVNVSAADINGNKAWCQFSYLAEIADCPSWQLNSRYKCTQKGNITVCSATPCLTREIPANIKELVCVPGHGWRILEEDIDLNSITHLGSAPKMQAAPICVNEMTSTVTLMLSYQLTNTNWQCSNEFLEKIRSKMSQFLEEQCNDVGWSYSGADTPNTMHIGLNFTTHNRNTALVLSCIETITGHVPLIPPPCPNSGVRRNSTKYHLRCPTGWGANNRLKCEKCPPGYHVKNESCAPCTRGTYIVNSEDIDCIKCPHGQTTLSDGAAGEHMCVAQCPPGFFSARSGLAPCIACPKGQYQPDFGQEQCILCDQGLTTADLATVNVNGCKSICNPGHYSSNGVQPCEACPRGLYNNISGATSCQRCPDNQSTDFEGASSKNDCHETDCASTGCKNHGDCYNGRCNCDLGFTGIQCDIALNLCHADFCLNGGSCKFNENDGSTCSCIQGSFTGRRCDKNLNISNNRFRRKTTNWRSASRSWHQSSSWYNTSVVGVQERTTSSIRFAPTKPNNLLKTPITTAWTKSPLTTPWRISHPATLRPTTPPSTPNFTTTSPTADCDLNKCFNGVCISNDCNCNDKYDYLQDGHTCQPSINCSILNICIEEHTKRWGTIDKDCCVCKDGYEGEFCERRALDPRCCTKEKGCKPAEVCLFETPECGKCYQECDENQYLKDCNNPQYLTLIKCQNDGILKYDGIKPFCDCRPKEDDVYIGEYCEARLSKCHKDHPKSLVCLNAGRCRDNGTVTECKCVQGFEGEYCERLVDFCVYLNCNKNNTRETIRHYGTCYCHCKEGYFGDTCDEEVNACEKRDIKLCGQGECKAVGVGYAPVNEYSGYKCVCKAGNLRASDNCLSFNSSCPLSNCYLPHGVCKDKSYNDTACICREGYYGKDCLEDVNYCSDETCLHNGTCHQGRDTRRLPRMMCDCPPETDGVNCEEMPSPCDKDPCGEHGECIPRGKYNFTCRCKDGYRAPQCITPPSQCVDGHSYCNEHGICKSYDRFDSCECFRGYTGRQCEQESTNQFNLFFTGRSVLKPPVHSMDVDCKTKDYITLTAWMKYDKSVYGFDTFPITLKNHHDDFVRIDRTKVIVNNVTIDISESKVGLEQWVYYVITYDVHNRIVSVVVNNGPAYKRDINVYCMTLKLLLGTQVNEKPMVPIFKGEMGLVQVHNVAFSFLEINEQIKNCLKWHFKEENVIISWRDINLTTWSRTDVQVLVPGVCSKTNCRNGAKECSPEIDRIPPKPINCPSLIRRNSTSRLYREDWGEIKFEDDSYIVEVKSNYFCNQTLTFGYYHVVYIAVDMHNNYGRCEFDVVIANEGESEPTLDASYTKSWYREFETDQVKSYQQLECIKNEHQFIDDNSPFYTMDFMNHWSVRGSYYPTCSKAEFPMQNLTGNLTNFNYDCDNQDELDYVTLERILWAINNASEEFEKTYDKGFCEKNDCTDNTIIIPPVCDNTTNFNKNRNRWSRAVTLDLFGTYEYILSTNNTQHVVRDFVIEALRKQFEVKKIRVYANNESWELPTPYQNFECADEAQYVRLTTELDNDQEQFFCFLPGPGKFFNKTLNKVEECHIGYYKETHGSELCSECGENRTTLIRGARNETDCFYINCNKGQYGDSEGCHPCKRGEYNNVGGRDKCNHCVPGWYTTLQEGSTKEDDCIWPCERWENYDLITGCAPCVNGTFMDFSVSPGCKPCNKGFTSEFNSTSKEDCKYVFCPLGFTIKNERNNSLTDDQTLSETTFINFCTPCAVGKYKHWHGNQNCASCPANSTTVAEGSKYKNDCSVIRCPDGNGKVCSAGYTCHNYMCTKVPNFQPEENWFGYVLASLSLGMLFILCIFCVIYRGFVVMYIDSSCPWILFCWKPKQGQRRFSVNPARDTSNLPMSPSSDDGPTNILETDIDDDRRPRFDTGSTDASCVRQRKLGAQSSNILDELRSNLMHVMASPTSAISSDSSGKRTPPPILTGSPSRRDLEAAKAAARVARSETYQMATFDNNPRIQFQSNFIRHHRTYGPLAVDARTNHTIPRVTIVSTETTSETNEDDDEGFFK